MNVPKINKKEWSEYCERERADVSPLLSRLGYRLDEAQVHTIGERFLMSGKKLVLIGTSEKDGKKVVIKTSRDPEGMGELIHEHKSREVIRTLDFAYRSVLFPEEILFARKESFIIVILPFIEETKPFFEHEFLEQFFLTLRSFEMLEGVHATAFSHLKKISSVWKVWGANEYLLAFEEFSKNILSSTPALSEAVNSAKKFLLGNAKVVEMYSGFLTHSDFVPHNLRTVGNDMYLLDHTSILFGNKYEAAARFLNYLCLYNLPLEHALFEYIRKNRGESEYVSLRLMRVYKIGFLLQFYTGSLAQTDGNLRLLTEARISFWKEALLSIVADKPVSEEMVTTYKEKRDSLRSEEEIQRQKEMHQL